MATTINNTTTELRTTPDATGVLALQTGGTNAVIIDTAQNVGIGITPSGLDRLELAAGTATLAPLGFTAGTLLTSADTGSMEFDGVSFYLTGASLNRGVVLSDQITVLSAPYTLTSQTAAQKLFNASTNGAITLPVGTYSFECFFSLTAMSATSGAFGFALGGTSTETQSWIALATDAALATPANSQISYNTTANTLIATASTATTGTAFISGIVRITVAGTLIPQVSLTTAAAAVVGTNSYFRIRPISTQTMTTVGNWS
jgi:hypothetical protein